MTIQSLILLFANSQRLSETRLTPHQTWDLEESPARLLKRSSSFINRPPKGWCYNCGHSQTFFEEYESPCDHGFFNRGDLEDPLVAECVQRGMDNTISFITQFVLSDWKLKKNIVEHLISKTLPVLKCRRWTREYFCFDRYIFWDKLIVLSLFPIQE